MGLAPAGQVTRLREKPLMIDALLEEAKSLVDRRKPSLAIEALGSALRRFPDDHRLLLAYGVLLCDMERPQEAVQVLLKAVRLQPLSSEVALAAFDALVLAGRRRLARKAATRLLRNVHATAENRLFRAELLLRIGDFAAAEQESHSVLASDGRRPFEILATSLIAQRRLSEARQVFAALQHKEATANLPPSSDGIGEVIRGRLEILLGNRSAGCDLLESAAGKRPFDIRLWMRIAALRRRLGNANATRSAIREAEKAQWWRPNSLVSLARFQSFVLDNQQAAATLTLRSLKLDPKNASARLLRTHCLIRLGRPDEAERLLSTLDQSTQEARRLAAEMSIERAISSGKTDEIATTLSSIRNVEHIEKTYTWVICRLKRDRLYEETASIFDKMHVTVMYHDFYFHLGLTYFRLHRHEDARTALIRAVRADVGHTEAKRWLHIVERALASRRPAENPFWYDPLTTRRRVSLMDNLTEHALVVKAMMLRETRTRYGRQRLGYMLAVIQPVVMLVVMLVILRYLRNRQPAGMSLELFMLTGIMGLRFFSQTMAQVSKAMNANRQLLLFPRVTPFDARVARVLLEMLTLTIVTVLFGLALHLGGGVISIDQPLYVIACVLVMCLIGFAAGIIIENLRAIWRSIDMMMGAINRFLFITSGVFFSVHDLPEPIRKYALLNPLLHVLENIRHGALASFPLHDTSMTYPILVGFGLLLIAFLMDVRLRKRAFEH